jgi:hypothetical protein
VLLNIVCNTGFSLYPTYPFISGINLVKAGGCESARVRTLVSRIRHA